MIIFTHSSVVCAFFAFNLNAINYMTINIHSHHFHSAVFSHCKTGKEMLQWLMHTRIYTTNLPFYAYVHAAKQSNAVWFQTDCPIFISIFMPISVFFTLPLSPSQHYYHHFHYYHHHYDLLNLFRIFYIDFYVGFVKSCSLCACIYFLDRWALHF